MNETYTLTDYIRHYQDCVNHNTPNMLDLILGIPQARHQSEYGCRLNLLITIADSMTLLERARPDLLNPSRCRRIARGSGTPWKLQGELLEEFFQARAWNQKVGEMSIREKILVIEDRFGPNANSDSDDQ